MTWKPSNEPTPSLARFEERGYNSLAQVAFCDWNHHERRPL